MLRKRIITVALFAVIWGCNSSEKTTAEPKVPNETLIVSSKGKLFNFNLETKKLTWEYISKDDTLSNRNRFSYDESTIYMPFESGRLLAADILSGKIRWENNYKPDPTLGDASNDGTGYKNSDAYPGPIFMAKPLVYNRKLFIPSAGIPDLLKSKLITVDATTGKTISQKANSTNYNYFQPIEKRGVIYVNSAIYLDVHYPSGSFGYLTMEDIADSGSPIYIQMQSNKNSLFLGVENGIIYSVGLSGDGFTRAAEVNHPEENSSGQKGIFDWQYQSEKYPGLGDGNTELVNNQLIVCKASDKENKSALIAINAKNGKEKWLYEPGDQIKNWQLANQDELTGYTKSIIFVLDTSGKVTFKIPIDPSLYPVSNIETRSDGALIYITGKGVVVIDRNINRTSLLIAHTFYPSFSPLNQIKYFKK